jgi:glycosyltransferase involved in cell wall biosynthesis
MSVGSMARHKNLSALKATASRLAERGIDLVLVGDANTRVFTDADSDLPPSVRWIGRHEDSALRTLYEGADCFVFPSLDESFGLPAVEAMTCRCPVVAARAGSLPEICGDAALLVDPSDPAGFAEAVMRVIDNAETAACLRRAGEARAAGFTWSAAASRLAAMADDIDAEGQTR